MRLLPVDGIGYLDYSYRERADRYRAETSPETAARIRDAAKLIRYSTLSQQVAGAGIEAIELLVKRRA
jgi:hypothetical protein